MTRPSSPVAVALLLVAVLAAGCGGQDEGAAGPPVRKTPVTVAQATRERVEAIETTVGRLESTSSPALAAETSGRVVRLLVDGGSVVKKGQVLAELDGEPQRLAVASARSSVERLEALLANQQRTVIIPADLSGLAGLVEGLRALNSQDGGAGPSPWGGVPSAPVATR